MDVIPVIDLMGGLVVRARMGQRETYQPIRTPLSPSSEPADVVRGLLTIHPFCTLYVADLDAIARRADHQVALRDLMAQFPQLTLWVDGGIADWTAADRWLDLGLGRLVLGSESQADAGLMRRLVDDPRVALSLDFRDQDLVGPPDLLQPAVWPRDLIVMTLARVGTGAGPDTARLREIVRKAGEGRRIYAAGGVRDRSDLVALAQLGVAGALVASSLHDGRLTGRDLNTKGESRDSPFASS